MWPVECGGITGTMNPSDDECLKASRAPELTLPALPVQGCFVFSLVKYKPLTYNKVYEYPDWAIALGWTLALASMICIPMVVVIKIIQSDGPLIEVGGLTCCLSTAHLGAAPEAFSCLLSTEDQGGGRSSPWRRQFTSQRAHLPTGPQWEQWWAEGANPHHCRNHDVKEQGGGSP